MNPEFGVWVKSRFVMSTWWFWSWGCMAPHGRTEPVKTLERAGRKGSCRGASEAGQATGTKDQAKSGEQRCAMPRAEGKGEGRFPPWWEAVLDYMVVTRGMAARTEGVPGRKKLRKWRP